MVFVSLLLIFRETLWIIASVFFAGSIKTIQSSIQSKQNSKFLYQSLLKNISHISENNISLIKTKLRSKYEKYSNVYVPYEYRRIVENLSKNHSIVIMKQDQGGGVVIMNKHKYTKKCLEM